MQQGTMPVNSPCRRACPHKRELRRRSAWRGAPQGCRRGKPVGSERRGVDVPQAMSAYRCSEPRGLSPRDPCGRPPRTTPSVPLSSRLWGLPRLLTLRYRKRDASGRHTLHIAKKKVSSRIGIPTHCYILCQTISGTSSRVGILTNTDLGCHCFGRYSSRYCSRLGDCNRSP